MAVSELEMVGAAASGMMRGNGNRLPADNEHVSGGHLVRRPLLLGVVPRRTSAPSVRHVVKASVPASGPVGMVLDKAMFVAIAAEYS